MTTIFQIESIAGSHQRAVNSSQDSPMDFRDRLHVAPVGPDSAEATQDLLDRLSETRHYSLVIREPMILGADPDLDIWFVYLLRIASSRGLTVDWTARTLPPWALKQIYHLPPPRRVEDRSCTGDLDAWHGAYRYGDCYFRKGPGFYLIEDGRAREQPRRLRLTCSADEDEFAALQQPVPLAGLSDSARRLARSIGEFGLVLEVGDHVLSLPIQLQWWPVRAPWGM